MKDVSFETLDLLSELGHGRKNAKPIALLARQLDVSKRKIVKMIECARAELEDSDILIMNTGHGSYYQEVIEDDAEQIIDPVLQLFRT